jgi:hypothetical protein
MSELSDIEIRALLEALDDEYCAWATYDQVIADFGDMPPFSNIREAEARHIDALRALFARYAVPVPATPGSGKVARYARLEEACEAGVAAEIANGEMYERLLRTTQREDIRMVLRRLQEASQQRHLPALQRCAEGSIGGRQRRGAGRARRRRRGQ